MVSRAINIGTDATPPNSLFSNAGYNNLFKVVHPQRRFKWTRVEVRQLWDDILKAHEQRWPWYFLGTLLLQPQESGKVAVIDGQQRISTLSILLAILQDCCKDYELEERAYTLNRLIARGNDDGQLTGALVLTLQQPDNEIYRSIVHTIGSTAELSSLHPQKDDRVLSAAKTLSNLVRDYIQNEPNSKEALRALCAYVQNNVKLLPIEVASEGQAYLVFDTTNTRGLRLSPAEAIKARLAAVAREDTRLSEELIKRWNSAANDLEQAGLPIDAMDNYLHTVWSSRHGYTTKRSLDKAVDRVVKDQGTGEVERVIEDVGNYIKSYLSVVRPQGNSRLSQDIRDLNQLNV